MSLIKNHDIVKRIFRDQYLPISCTRLNISYDSSQFDRRPRHFAKPLKFNIELRLHSAHSALQLLTESYHLKVRRITVRFRSLYAPWRDRK